MKTGTIYKGRQEDFNILFTRAWAMPNHATFKIGVIAKLLERYVPAGGFGWFDPFAGNNSPAQWTNDHNPETKAGQHVEALEFVNELKDGTFAGVLFDPPYSFRQVTEHYKLLGQKATKLQTGTAFYEKVKSAACKKIRIGGHAISFGWNSNGFGKARGFRIVEILQVAHGGSKNDTICVVEEKIK